jgi:hypothetical protein
MNIQSRTAESSAFLDTLMVSTSEVVGEIERQIVGQRQGKVWCAPKAVVLPGDVAAAKGQEETSGGHCALTRSAEPSTPAQFMPLPDRGRPQI